MNSGHGGKNISVIEERNMSRHDRIIRTTSKNSTVTDYPTLGSTAKVKVPN
jgi:hypothetical protein